MDSKYNYIAKMEQAQGNSDDAAVRSGWVLPSKEDFLKELNEEENDDSIRSYHINEALKTATEHAFISAALSGRFTPADVIHSSNSIDQNAILNVLMPFCNIETAETNVYWTLKADKRREVLAHLSVGDAFQSVLEQLHPIDDFGALLRKIITNKYEIIPENLQRNDLVLLAAVLESIQGLQIPKPDIVQVKNLLELKSFIENYHHLTVAFVGRKPELKKLSVFLNSTNKWSWDGLILKGAGGTGKSTLLAKFCTEVMDDKLATLVLIDFDRPGMNPQDTAWLQDELVRQIGIQFPDQKEKLKSVIEDNQFRQENYSSSRGNVLESMEYEKLSIRNSYIIREILIETHKPLLIVLDTLEEVFQQNSYEKLLNWIEMNCQIFSPISIKVIFSGRIEKEFTNQADDYSMIFLDAFDKPSAKLFLKKYGNDAATINAILKSGQIPLRPLELKLITKILKDQQIPFDVLEKDLFSGKNSNVSKDFYTGMIYRRVLNRIKNEDVRKIAYPGLLLRYITADLIDVLQPILDLPIMDDAKKDQVLSDLESYGWLSYRENGNEIWHRKDLRRIMIRMIMEQQPEQTAKIRTAAIAYFDTQRSEKGNAESLYHKLMLTLDKNELENYSISELKSASDFILTDDVDLPKSAAVMLQFARNGKVATADLEHLPDKYFKKLYEKTGRRFIARQQFKEAYALYERAQKIGFTISAGGLGLADRWEEEMLFNLGKFEELRLLKSYQKSPELAAPLMKLLHYIFPAMLISPADVHFKTAASLLENACKQEKSLQNTLSGPDSLTVVTRLAYSLAVINDVYGLSNAMVLNLRQLEEVLKRSYKTGHAERSRLVLHTLAYSRLPKLYYMSLSNLKLQAEWFIKLQQYSENPIQNLIEPTLDLIRQTASRPMAARSFLNRIDSMEDIRSAWYEIAANLEGLDSQAIYDITRGPNSTFLKACIAAVYDTLNNKCIPIENLRAMLFDCICTNITDLQPGIFEKMVLRNTNWLEPLIELIDREQSLVKFMNQLHLAAPEAKILTQVNEALQRWEKAVALILKASTSEIITK